MFERQRAAWIGAAVVAAGLTLAGCSGTSGTPTSPNPSTPTSSVAAAPTSSAPAAAPGTITSVSDGRNFMAKAFPGLTCDQGMPESPNSYGRAAFLDTSQVTVITCGPPDTAYTMYLAPAGSVPTSVQPVDHTQQFSTAWAVGSNFAITSEQPSTHGLCSASVRLQSLVGVGLTVSKPGASSRNTYSGPIACPQSPAPTVNTGADGHDLMTKAFPALSCNQGLPVTPSTSTGSLAQSAGGPVAAFSIFPNAKTVTLVTCSPSDPAHEQSMYLYIAPLGVSPVRDGFGTSSANGPNYVVVAGTGNGDVCNVTKLPGKPDIQGSYLRGEYRDGCF